jgi:signal transduction histidine kinase/HAMP domain-containing protein
MRDVRLCTLQWAVGALCAVTGALIYVAPHQFSAPVYATLQPELRWWAGLFLLAGLALLGTVALSTRRALVLTAHLLGAVALLGLALSLLRAGAWIGGLNYLTLGLGLAAGPLLAARWPPAVPVRGRDALALLIALGSTTTGAAILLSRGQFNPAAGDLARPVLPWYGGLFLLGGLGLLAAQRRATPEWLRIAACLLVGAIFLTFLVLVALPSRTWAGIAYFGGFGLIMAALPWLAPRLQAVDPESLQTRLVFLLTTASALPLILTVALVTHQQEQTATAQMEAQQQTLATVMAQDVADVIGLHRAAVAGLASRPGLLALAPAEQAQALRSLSQAYADITAFSLYDRTGQGLARSDDRLLVSFAGNPEFERMRLANQFGIRVMVDQRSQQPAIGLMEPIRDRDGQFAGLAVGVIDPIQIARLFESASTATGAKIGLVDERGRVIAHAGFDDIAVLTDLSALPPVAALLAAPDRPGTLRYGLGAGECLAGYAPVTGFGWGVIVETPAPAALASVRAGRELTFGLLVIVVSSAAVAGWVTAGWLARPLAALARAVASLSAGDATAPLPHTHLTEVRRLAQGFGDLRDRLAARTAEREQAEARLRFLAEASRQLAASLDSTETLASVARLAVPHLADYCIIDLVQENGEVRRVATGHGPPERQALVAQLRRFPPSLAATGRHSVGRVIRTGQADLAPVLTDAQIDEIAHDPDHRALLRALAPTSHVIVPLIARGRTLGALTFVSTGGRRQYGPADLALAEELARRAALAIDNAGLYGEAQGSIRLREEFLSIASHELRTPLTTVKGYVQLLARRLRRDAPSSEPSVQLVDQLELQVGRLEALISDLLDVSHLHQGRLNLRPEPVDLHALASEVLARFSQAPELTDRHQLALAAPQPVRGVWDASRLDQVLTNLISNALKYSPEGGEVRVSITATDAWAEIAVSDQGIGIPPAEQAKLFQPFARGETARQRFAGTGLGLYISAQIVERHGGTLTVQSEPGVGSIFTVRLPRAATAGAAADGYGPAATTPAPARGTGSTT